MFPRVAVPRQDGQEPGEAYHEAQEGGLLRDYEWIGLIIGLLVIALAYFVTHSLFNAVIGGAMVGQFIGALPFRIMIRRANNG